jgi:hypothetical protein
MHREHFYVGWSEWGDSAGEFIASSLFHDQTGIRSVVDHELTAYQLLGEGSAAALVVRTLASIGLPIIVMLLLSTVWTLLWRIRRSGVGDMNAANRLLLMSSFCVLATLGAYATLHTLVGLRYPSDRTIIYLVPLLALSWTLLPEVMRQPNWRRFLQVSTSILGIVVIVLCATGIRLTYYRTWRFDAGTREMVEVMRNALPAGESARIASHWLYAQGPYFYHLIGIRNGQSIWLRPWTPVSQANFLITHPGDPRDDTEVDEAQWSSLAENPISGVRLYQRRVTSAEPQEK